MPSTDGNIVYIWGFWQDGGPNGFILENVSARQTEWVYREGISLVVLLFMPKSAPLALMPISPHDS